MRFLLNSFGTRCKSGVFQQDKKVKKKKEKKMPFKASLDDLELKVFFFFLNHGERH